ARLGRDRLELRRARDVARDRVPVAAEEPGGAALDAVGQAQRLGELAPGVAGRPPAAAPGRLAGGGRALSVARRGLSWRACEGLHARRSLAARRRSDQYSSLDG